jgi:hypothetical protein
VTFDPVTIAHMFDTLPLVRLAQRRNGESS